MTEQPPGETSDALSSNWGGGGTPEGRRIVALLWEPAEAAGLRGPRAKLTLAEVVKAGTAEADEQGLAALSVRRVAKRLGIAAMSVYTYVPGRSELIELMIDSVYAEFSLPDPALDWRERLTAHVEQSWLMLRRHPWLLDYNVARMPVGPHVLDVEEALYAALATAGLRPPDVVLFTNLIGWHLRGLTRVHLADSEEERRTGVSAEAYWEARNSFWSTYFEPVRYPTMLWLWEAGVFDDPDQSSYEAAMPRVLSAVLRLIEDRVSGY
ncbi:MAG TPA: TetR/AcrR family transcriptional regulator [Propionibacteriaceae bacterium]|nr:TetR/AcrR family transcriptional regulator [Propionibacteriaceae bacterium]